MPLQRFRDLASMRTALRRTPASDPARQLALVLDFWRRAVPRRIPRGVHRFHDIEQANRAREDWLTEEVHRLQAERRTKATR